MPGLLESLRFLERDLNSFSSRTTRDRLVEIGLSTFPADNAYTRDEFELAGHPISQSHSDPRVARLLRNLHQTLAPVSSHLLGCWLHGSLSTGDYTLYSDVDAILILKDESIQNELAFIEVQRAVLRALRHVLFFDPLQHHGFFVGVESLMNNWPSAYLPGAALQYAWPLFPLENPIILHEWQDRHLAVVAFEKLARAVQKARIPKNLYDAKHFLSQFMLLPAIYLQALGRPVYKRESFSIVREQFRDHWKPVEEATRMRADWQMPRRPFWGVMLRILNPWQASRIYRQFERQLPICQNYQDWAGFLADIKRFAQRLLEEL